MKIGVTCSKPSNAKYQDKIDRRRSTIEYEYVYDDVDIKMKTIERCRSMYIEQGVDKINDGFAKLLDKHHIEYQRDFYIQDKLYDFYVPKQKTVIELDPTITHNSYMDIFDENSDGLYKRYHLHKTKFAEDNGYRCIHIFDWEQQEKMIPLVQNKKTIYARKCKLTEIEAPTANAFEDICHIQGKCRRQLVCLGLYYEGELVEVMTFGKPRYNRKYEWELLRLCTAIDKTVVGGASKLFKYFLNTYNPKSIISYCDKSKFNGEVYEKIGMILDHTTDPNKLWSRGKNYLTNNFLLQHGYDQIFAASFGKGTNNEELILNDGWLPVFDCGQNVYSWHNQKEENK